MRRLLLFCCAMRRWVTGKKSYVDRGGVRGGEGEIVARSSKLGGFMFSRKTRQSASPKGSQNEVQNELQVDRFRYRILLPKPSKILELFQNIKEFLENFPSIFFSLEIVERNEACFSRPAMLSCLRVCQGTRFFQSTISRV